MKDDNINVLVSGASGILGYGILRSLKMSKLKVNVIATTIFENSIAECFCNVFEKAIPTNDTNYISWLIKIIKKHNIQLIIPGIEDDMYKWKKNLLEIRKTGVQVVINNEELIALCNDKWEFYKQLKLKNYLYSIPTTEENNYNNLVEKFGVPFLLKPKKGHGSKGMQIINGENEFLKFKNFVGKTLIAQPIIGTIDEEYTTSAFGDGKGGYYASCTLKRKLSKDGYTDKAELVEIDEINKNVKELCKIFTPIGPTNFQFRKHNETYKLLEINPRISSATSIRAKFNYNESIMSVDFFINGVEPIQPILKKGKAIRYIEEYISYE